MSACVLGFFLGVSKLSVSPAQLTLAARIVLPPRSDPALLYEPSFERS